MSARLYAPLRQATRSVHTSYSQLARRRKTDVSPLQQAFKFNDEDEDDKPRYESLSTSDAPNLMALEKRWNKMDALDQEDVMLYLEDKTRGDWRQLSDEEKKAIWYVNYGSWGPRSGEAHDHGSIYGGYAKLVAGIMAAVGGYKAYEEFGKTN